MYFLRCCLVKAISPAGVSQCISSFRQFFFCLCCFFSRLLFVIIFVFVDSGPFCIYLLSKIHNTAHLRDCVGAIVIYVPAIVICFRPQNPGCRDVYKKKIYGQIEKATEKRACAPHTPTDQQQSALK